MRPGKLVIAFFVVLVLASLLFLQPTTIPEPVIEGRRLSEWTLSYGVILKSGPQSVLPAPRPQYNGRDVAKVIQSCGTNAFPFLLRWSQYQPGVLRREYLRLQRVNPFSRRPVIDPHAYLASASINAFGALRN